MTQRSTIRITRTVRFCAAHRYHSDSLSEAENERIFGKCHRPHGHGHDYRVDVAVEGPVDPVTGMVMNLADLDRLLKDRVVETLDHNFLNFDVPHFAEVVPTCENIALFIVDQIREPLGEQGHRLAGVRLWEGDDLYAEVEVS